MVEMESKPTGSSLVRARALAVGRTDQAVDSLQQEQHPAYHVQSKYSYNILTIYIEYIDIVSIVYTVVYTISDRYYTAA